MTDTPAGSETTGSLRDRLTRMGIRRSDVLLPEDRDVAASEGALAIERTEAGTWVLVTVDYGQRRLLGESVERSGIESVLLDYLDRPLPAAREIPEHDLMGMLAALEPSFADLRARADGGLLIDIPAGVLLDRIGALDGIHLYPLDTAFEQRSLPPHALNSPQHAFITQASLRSTVTLIPPWFGRPGGGLRFTVEDSGLGIRDLVVAGMLERIARVL